MEFLTFRVKRRGKKMNDFVLSDKRYPFLFSGNSKKRGLSDTGYNEKDVKEFIRRLKEEITNYLNAVRSEFISFENVKVKSIINRLAGEKLI